MDLKTILELMRPCLGVRGYRLLKRAATINNLMELYTIALADTIGGNCQQLNLPAQFQKK